MVGRWSMLLVVAVVVAGCAADPDAPDPIDIDRMEQTTGSKADDGASEPDVCALAAQLSADDVCSKACDPDALAAQVEAEGGEPGFCYQFYCALPEDQHVVVGVCLAP